MRILLTGGSGRLGSQIIQDGKSIHQIFAPSSTDMNIISPRDVNTFFDHCKPNAVIHSAALTDVDYCELDKHAADEININGTKIIAQAAKRYGAKVIFISTDFVFDGRSSFGYFETAWRNPINHYGLTKQKAEDIITGFNYQVVRTSWLFDEHNPSLITKILDKVDNGLELRYQTKRKARMTYVPDLSRFVLDLAASDQKDQYYHYSSTPSMSAYAIAQMVVRSYLGLDCPEIIPDMSHPELTPGAPRPANSSIFDTKDVSTSKDFYSLSRVQKIVKKRINDKVN